MRYSWLVIGLTLSVSACSNATFKGVKGSSSHESAPTTPPDGGDATGKTPTPIPPAPEPPGSSTPPSSQNPEDPNAVPCTPMNLAEMPGLQCPTPIPGNDTQDSGDPQDNTDDSENGSDPDDPGQNNPGQN